MEIENYINNAFIKKIAQLRNRHEQTSDSFCYNIFANYCSSKVTQCFAFNYPGKILQMRFPHVK